MLLCLIGSAKISIIFQIARLLLNNFYLHLESLGQVAYLYRISPWQHIRAYPLITQAKYNHHTIRILYFNPTTISTINTSQFNSIIFND